MDERKQHLLKAIIEAYIHDAVPVGSKLLVDTCHLDYSPATARNEMMALEEEGFLTHPHTSAGRIPTEKGFEFYVRHFLNEPKLAKGAENALSRAVASNLDQVVKSLARSLADISDETVFVGFGPAEYYYTGLSNLFRKPEFSNVDLVINMSEMIDHFDDVICKLFNRVKSLEVMVGSRNPFSDQCSIVVAPYKYRSQHGIFGILGPMRMNYEHTTACITTSARLLVEAK